MLSEYSFKPDEINVSNLNKLSVSQSEMEELRICELAELAFSAADFSRNLSEEGMNLYEILSLISDSVSFDRNDLHSDAYSGNVSSLLLHLKGLATIDKAAFSRLYIERMKAFDMKVREDDILLPSVAPETFVYVKNSFADEAYDVFSQEFRDPRVEYASSFKEALSRVKSGEVTHALLPLEERGSRIRTVVQLIFTEDFKINSVTPVFGFDGTADMKYALVSSEFAPESYTEDDDRYLEIRLEKSSSLSLAELLLSAESFGAEVYRVATTAFDTDEGKKEYFSVVFRSEGADFSPLLVFLILFVPEHTLVGVYKNLE